MSEQVANQTPGVFEAFLMNISSFSSWAALPIKKGWQHSVISFGCDDDSW